MLEWLLVFLALVLVDVLNAIYIKHIEKNNAVLASSTAVVLFLAASMAVIGYVDNNWLLIPASAGAFVGTYIGIKINKKMK
jgi:uncharacterized membrane protein YfcA